MIISHAEEMNPTRRTTMEDACVIHGPGEWGCEKRTFVGVYDGHGGREMVDYLEYGMAYHVSQEIRDSKETDDMHAIMERAFLTADIHAKHAGIISSGATVALCLIENVDGGRYQITAANVGDGRIVLGKITEESQQSIRLTVDHKIDDALEVARIEKAGGFLFKGRVCGVLAVSRSLGDQILKPYVTAHPAVREIMADTGDVLICACDGLWDVFTDANAIQFVQEFEGRKEDVAHYLIKEAVKLGTSDNITAVVVWF